MAPHYYQFEDGTEVADISKHLTGMGAQALQYIARSTRLDGENKGNEQDEINDLHKAIDMITFEIERKQRILRRKTVEALKPRPASFV